MTKLSGEQAKLLQEAILSAFPTWDSLAQMVSFELNKNLEAIARGSDLSAVVFRLIQRAQSEGGIQELVKGALAARPNNPQLKAFVEQVLGSGESKLIPEPTADRDVHQPTDKQNEILATNEVDGHQPTDRPDEDLPTGVWGSDTAVDDQDNGPATGDQNDEPPADDPLLGKIVTSLVGRIWDKDRAMLQEAIEARLWDRAALLRQGVPTGIVKLGSPFYVERSADLALKQQLDIPGTITTIYGGRQTGKTSLLRRGIDWARKPGTCVLYVDFPEVMRASQSEGIRTFLRQMAYDIAAQADVDLSKVDEIWDSPASTQSKLASFMDGFVLDRGDRRVLLAISEADSLLDTDFCSSVFGMLRHWHNRRLQSENWARLSIVMTIATHSSWLIEELNQSPFNVGLSILQPRLRHRVVVKSQQQAK